MTSLVILAERECCRACASIGNIGSVSSLWTDDRDIKKPWCMKTWQAPDRTKQNLRQLECLGGAPPHLAPAIRRICGLVPFRISNQRPIYSEPVHDQRFHPRQVTTTPFASASNCLVSKGPGPLVLGHRPAWPGRAGPGRALCVCIAITVAITVAITFTRTLSSPSPAPLGTCHTPHAIIPLAADLHGTPPAH